MSHLEHYRNWALPDRPYSWLLIWSYGEEHIYFWMKTREGDNRIDWEWAMLT